MVDHSKPPWTPHQSKQWGDYWIGQEGGHHFTVAKMIKFEKDVRLIAAAPDLLEAVEGLLEIMETNWPGGHTLDGVILATEAVAKAKQAEVTEV